jgi:hypothetical protein
MPTPVSITPINKMKTTLTLLLAASLALPAYAQTVSTAVTSTTTVGTHQANAAARLQAIITRSDAAINARIAALNALSTRVSALKNVSATEKANISTEVQTNISGLTTLKAKIDADTDVTTAQTDAKQITGYFRIYALVIPQGWIASSADRVNTIVGMLTAIGTKLQTRITAAQTAGKDVTAANTALTDFNAKLTDATTQSVAANAGIAGLVPDQGDQTKLAANTAALKAARADIKTATQDLLAARADAKVIVQDTK